MTPQGRKARSSKPMRVTDSFCFTNEILEEGQDVTDY